MADTPADLMDVDPPDVQRICLHVVSPGPENRQTFPSLPVTTSIAQLKLLIANASPLHPAPSRQRLIYRGRRLAVDTDTLANVFGPLEANGSRPTFTIHLVLPPMQPQPSQGSHDQFNPSTSVNRAQATPPPLPEDAIRAALTPQQRIQNILASHAVPHETASNLLQPGFSHPTPQAIHQALSSLNQNVLLPNTVGPNGEVQQHPIPGFQTQRDVPFTRQQITRQAQTTHMSQTSITYSSQTQNHNTPGGNIRSEIHMSFAQTSSSTQPPTPNPQRSIHDSIMEVPHRVRLNPYGFQPGDMLEDPVTENTPLRNQFRVDIRAIQLRLTFMEQQALAVGRRFPLMALAPMAQQLLAELELACQKSNVSHDDPFATDVRRRINLLLSSNGEQTDQPSRATNSTQPVTNVSPSPTASTATPPSSTRRTSASPANPSIISATVNMANMNSSVYLLSSPNGPQALLFAPRATSSTANSNRLTQRANAQRNITRARTQEARQRLAGQQHARAVQARHNQRGDNLTAIARSVWLLLRLLFFFWFFGVGGTWTRLVIVLFGCSIVFLAHAGVFAPLREWWNPIREHLEALIPLAADNVPNNARPAPAQGDRGQVQRPGEPNPQETATRLLRERQAQDGNWVQGNLRRVERAIALFMATLVPGVGERHIRARNAAEALRLAEQRQADEERQGQAQRSNGVGQNPENSNALVTDANENEQPADPMVDVQG